MKHLATLLFSVACMGSSGPAILGQDKPGPKKEVAYANLEESKAAYDRVLLPFLAEHCLSCHATRRTEGDLDLKKLEFDMKGTPSAARWAMVREKLTTRAMPPEGRPRPKAADVEAVVHWIDAEMKRSGKHFARRVEYANGNKVDHGRLFDPNFKAPFSGTSRVRRLSPEIYAAFLKDISRGATGLGQPFTPPGYTTFKDMGAPRLDEPTTVQLIGNALGIVERQTAHKVVDGKIQRIGFVPREFVDLLDEKIPLKDDAIAAALHLQFKAVLARQPTKEEQARFTALMRKNVQEAGRVVGVRYTLAAAFLLPEAIFRWELGVPLADAPGKKRLSPREIAFALAYALTDKRPQANLLTDAAQGKLDTDAGVAQAVRGMLDDTRLDRPRILRFFREYFGYDRALEVFQDQKASPDHDPRILVEDTDRLVEHILSQDRNVLGQLLTTNTSFVAYKTAADLKKKRARELAKFEERRRKEPERYKTKKPPMPGKSVYLAYGLPDFPDTQPVQLPASERAGILTQPSWLAAYAKTGENHAIFRGKWVRERLLGGVVPDIPITVDAQLPETPHHTLRQRMEVTRQDYCWKCHQLMNPVGLPFEAYDHLGAFRKVEKVLDPDATAKNVDKRGKSLGPVHRDVPVDASGRIDLVVDKRLKTDVKNAVDLLHQLARSEHVEQVFVRHAFRYWMGRNENLGDGPSLQRAHRAYRESGGSMKALIVALLTSESFLYRVSSTPSVGNEK